jgi:hypothetical protein
MPWELDGNNIGANAWLGSRSAQPLRIRTSNTEKMTITPDGNAGIGNTAPRRRLQIGSVVNGIGFDPADVSPNAGYIRFGDNTGWKLHFGREQEGVGSPPNTGTAGVLMTIQDNGNVGIGTTAPGARLDVQGDIRLLGADCAEYFQVEDGAEIESGTVLVIDEDSTLQECEKEYDKQVAGVVSGAGGLRPGIVLDNGTEEVGVPVALTGKVYCKVDAEYSPVEVGDLLTTSSTPGYAMKADDPLRAFGAVIGKALRPLSQGTDMIPIIVALQ